MRYTVNFGPTNTGLTPTFITFKLVSTLDDVTPMPSLTEVTGIPGTYFFDYSVGAGTQDILYLTDAGAGAPDATHRYVSGRLSTKDTFLDVALSAVKTSADSAASNTADLPVFLSGFNDVISSLITTLQGADNHTLTELANNVGHALVPGVEGGPATGLYLVLAGISTVLDGMIDAESSLATAVGGIAGFQGTPDDPSTAGTEFGRLAGILAMGAGGGSVEVGASTDAPGAATLFGQLYAARDAIKAKTDLIPVDFATQLSQFQTNITRLLGLSRENSVWDQTTFDSKNNITSARLRIFGSKADAQSGSSPTATYTITATYVDGTANLQTYSMVRES